MKLQMIAWTIVIWMHGALWGQNAVLSTTFHQSPDQDGIYYSGPEVSTPVMLTTVSALYPQSLSRQDPQGMTVMATVIDARGLPTHIQVLHSHGDDYDQCAVAALKQSTFQPGMLNGKPVPVWIDVRVVFHENHAQALPQTLVTERDLAPPDPSSLEDKHHNPLSYTPPFAIHTVDADFANPFAAHPYVQVAIVNVLVSIDGLPKEVNIQRGLGFGLDQKAVAAVWHYRFKPALKKGRPVEERASVMVPFAEF